MYSIIRKDGTEYGPISAEMLKDWLSSNLLDGQTKIRRVGETEWTTIGALPEFTGHLPPPLPPVPPPKPYSGPSSRAATINSPDQLLTRSLGSPHIALKILIGVVSQALMGFCMYCIVLLGILLSVLSHAPEFGDSAGATAVAIMIFTFGLLWQNRINLYLSMGAALLSSVAAGVILFAHFGSKAGYSHRALMENPALSLHYQVFVGCTLGLSILPIVMLILKRPGRAGKNNPTDDRSAGAGEDSLLASRWQRLGASLIDALIMVIFAGPVLFLLTSGKYTPSAIWGFGAFFFVLFNGKLLHDSGQTIGKRLVKIQIVDLHGDLPSVQKHLLPRYAFYLLAGMIPVAGPFIGLINILFIFGGKQRCLHDFLAGTRVVIKL